MQDYIGTMCPGTPIIDVYGIAPLFSWELGVRVRGDETPEAGGLATELSVFVCYLKYISLWLQIYKLVTFRWEKRQDSAQPSRLRWPSCGKIGGVKSCSSRV